MNSALFQTRVDVFEDASEGAFGYKNIRIRDEVAAALGVERPAYVGAEGALPLDFNIRDLILAARHQTVLTCWFTHRTSESYPMWRVYGGDEFAIAIATTVGALRSVFQATTLAKIGAVQYAPLPRDVDSIHTLFFHKRQEYEAECEIRSVHVLSVAPPERSVPQSLTPKQLDQLLAELVSAPGMRPSMFATILATVQSKFKELGLTFDPSRLRRSTLDNDLLR